MHVNETDEKEEKKLNEKRKKMYEQVNGKKFREFL